MALWYDSPTCAIFHGDVLEELRGVGDGTVNCCVTSPPYWGLRDYGTGQWEGGDARCDHSKKCSSVPHGSTLASAPTNSNHEKEGWKGGVCGQCGAIRIDQQLGLEKTPEEYIAKMVEVFREVRRVLRNDGTCWVNMGDSYAANRGYQVPDNKHKDVGNAARMTAESRFSRNVKASTL